MDFEVFVFLWDIPGKGRRNNHQHNHWINWIIILFSSVICGYLRMRFYLGGSVCTWQKFFPEVYWISSRLVNVCVCESSSNERKWNKKRKISAQNTKRVRIRKYVHIPWEKKLLLRNRYYCKQEFENENCLVFCLKWSNYSIRVLTQWKISFFCIFSATSDLSGFDLKLIKN